MIQYNVMICNQTGKFQHETKVLAESVIGRKKRIRKSHMKDNKRFHIKLDTNETCAYKCHFCGKWHIAGKKKF
jgi:hypothetical protein